MRILVLNAGSSTLKAAVAETDGGAVTFPVRMTIEDRDGNGGEALFRKALDPLGAAEEADSAARCGSIVKSSRRSSRSCRWRRCTTRSP